MPHLVVNGGKKLTGSVTTQSTKNSALSIVCATLMIDGRTTITDLPAIDDLAKLIRLLKSAGASVEQPDTHTLVVDTSGGVSADNLERKASETMRASLLLLGALASRTKKYKLYKAGGCHLGERTVRPHVYALEKLGVHVESKDGYYDVHNSLPLVGTTIVMYESGDTTTENAIMAAVKAQGRTVIKMASANYMVQDLCYFLVAAGAKIEGIGTTTLTIDGVEKLSPPASGYAIMPDPIVCMTLIAAAIVTQSRLTVNNCPMEFLELELEKLRIMGQAFTVTNERLSTNGKFRIADIEFKPSKLTALPDKIYGRPFPGLNIDNLPLFIPILAVAEGRTLVHDWVYEDRVMYSLELKKLGASISLIDTHRVWVEGPTDFKPNEVIAPPALRPAVNVLLCMLAAPGTSRLRGYSVIERGYEDLPALLNAAGADITISPD